MENKIQFLDYEGLQTLWSCILQKISNVDILVDDTLTIENRAADAKTVGDLISAIQEGLAGKASQEILDALSNNFTNFQDEVTLFHDNVNTILDSDDTTLDQLSEIVAYIKSNKALIDAVTTAKQNTITGAASTITDNNLTPDKVLISDSENGKVAVSGVSTQELNQLKDIDTSITIQQQFTNLNDNLNNLENTVSGKAEQTALEALSGVVSNKQDIITGAVTTVLNDNLNADVVPVANNEGKIVSSSVTNTELSYLSGLVGFVQNQIDGKLGLNDVTIGVSGEGNAVTSGYYTGVGNIVLEKGKNFEEKNILFENSLTGNVVQFSEEIDYIPNVISTIKLAQAGSGEPYPAGGGKNLCSINELYNVGWANDRIEITNILNSLTSGTYTLSFSAKLVQVNDTTYENRSGVVIYVNNQEVFHNAIIWDNNVVGDTHFHSLTLEITDDIVGNFTNSYFYDCGNDVIGSTGTVNITNLQIEQGSVATAFEPYSNIRPISGIDAVNITRCGKNLFNINDAGNAFGCVLFENGTIVTDGTGSSDCVSAYIPVNPGAAMTILVSSESFNASSVCFYDENKKYISGIAYQGRYSLSFITPENAAYLRMTASSAYNFQLELGSTATPYEPYQSNTFTATFGQTVYGGTLDWNTGKLTAEWALRQFDGTEDWLFHQGYVFTTGFEGVGGPVSGGLDAVMSHYSRSYQIFWNNMEDMSFLFGADTWSLSTHILIRDSLNSTSPEAWKAYLAAQHAAGTPVQLCYKLAEPQIIQLPPQQITALRGTNTLISNDIITIGHDRSLSAVASDTSTLLGNNLSEYKSGESIEVTTNKDYFTNITTTMSLAQSGEGTPYPHGGGVNLITGRFRLGDWDGTNPNIRCSTDDKILVKAGESYTFSGFNPDYAGIMAFFEGTDASFYYETTDWVYGESSVVFSPSKDGYIIPIFARVDLNTTLTENDLSQIKMSVLKGDVTPAFFEYSNIRPFYTTSSFTLTNSNSTESNTYTVQIGQSVVEGTLEWDTGIFTARYSYSVISNPNLVYKNTGIEGDGNTIYIISYSNLGYSIAQDKAISCSHLPYAKNLGSLGITNGPEYGVVFLNFNRFDTTAELRNYLNNQISAGTPVQIAFELNEPLYIQLTPQQVKVLSGTNTLSSNIGTTSVSYPTATEAIELLSRKINIISAMPEEEKQLIGYTKYNAEGSNLFAYAGVAIREAKEAGLNSDYRYNPRLSFWHNGVNQNSLVLDSASGRMYLSRDNNYIDGSIGELSARIASKSTPGSWDSGRWVAQVISTDHTVGSYHASFSNKSQSGDWSMGTYLDGLYAVYTKDSEIGLNTSAAIKIAGEDRLSDLVPYRALSADRLNASAGDLLHPIFFNSEGQPQSCTYGLNAEIHSYEGSLVSNGWNSVSNNKKHGPFLSVSYNNNAPANWNSGGYSATLVFGASDTRGLLDCHYGTPIVTFGGASHGGASTDNPNWYMKIQGTNQGHYMLDDFASLSKDNTFTGNNTLHGILTNTNRVYTNYLHSKILTSYDIQGYTNSEITIVPVIGYGELNVATSISHDEFLKAYIKRVCELFPNRQGKFIGTAYPNNRYDVQLNIYNTSLIDSSTGLPQYCWGVSQGVVNPNQCYFGTNNYNFYSYNALSSYHIGRSFPALDGSGAYGTWDINIRGTAGALTTNAGSASQPVYFANGVPVACNTTTQNEGFKTGVVVTKDDGVTEIGAYLDFHTTTNVSDYSVRLNVESTGDAQIGFTFPLSAGKLLAMTGPGSGNTNCPVYFDSNGIAQPMFTTWNWDGRNETPTWVWGANDSANSYVYNPRYFHVSYADSAGSAGSATYASHDHQGYKLYSTQNVIFSDTTPSGTFEVGTIWFKPV